jgi:formylglycine-generating enzyme
MRKGLAPARAGMSALALLCALGPAAPAARADGDFRLVPGAEFRSVLPAGPKQERVRVADFRLARTPVTNGEFLEFVRRHPQWQRGRVAGLFADAGYLRHWAGPLELGGAQPRQPVVHVSWFAATAYCEAQGARLPTWHEWEWAAAADERRPDARDDPAWRQQLLDWYAQTGRALPPVGSGTPNLHGVHDLHAGVWEWVDDFGAMMVSGDNREQGDPDLMRFCGAGAMTMEQKENYAVLMRIAMLSSLQARYTTANLGFRCAKKGSDDFSKRSGR